MCQLKLSTGSAPVVVGGVRQAGAVVETIPPATTPASARRLGPLQGSALYLGAVLGTGVIALPALAAKTAGPASLLAWVGLVVLSVPLAATFAALGSRHPDAGGVSTYSRRAFGDTAGVLVGWCFWFAMPVGAPAAALFGGAYVADAVGGGRTTTVVTAALLIVVVGAANGVGVHMSARLQLALAAVLLTLMVVSVAVSLPHARAANLHPFAPHGYGAVTGAGALLVWSFAGWEAITHLAGEFRRPERDLAARDRPRARSGRRALPRGRVRNGRRARPASRDVPRTPRGPARLRHRRGARDRRGDGGAAHRGHHECLLRRRRQARCRARARRCAAELAGPRQRRRRGPAPQSGRADAAERCFAGRGHRREPGRASARPAHQRAARNRVRGRGSSSAAAAAAAQRRRCRGGARLGGRRRAAGGRSARTCVACRDGRRFAATFVRRKGLRRRRVARLQRPVGKRTECRQHASDRQVRLRLRRGQQGPEGPARRQGREPRRDDQPRPAGAARVHHHHRGLQGLPRQRRASRPGWPTRSASTSTRSRRRWASGSARPTTRCWCRSAPARSSRCPG